VSAFDSVEADFFGDMAQDTHGLWEVFVFIRYHHPQLADDAVFTRGCDYITCWADAGWIRISDSPLYPSAITTLSEIPQFLQQHGSAATRYIENSPSLEITDEGQRVYESQRSNQSLEPTAGRCTEKLKDEL
jgi:hypothetical protein